MWWLNKSDREIKTNQISQLIMNQWLGNKSGWLRLFPGHQSFEQVLEVLVQLRGNCNKLCVFCPGFAQCVFLQSVLLEDVQELLYQSVILREPLLPGGVIFCQGVECLYLYQFFFKHVHDIVNWKHRTPEVCPVLVFHQFCQNYQQLDSHLRRHRIPHFAALEYGWSRIWNYGSLCLL